MNSKKYKIGTQLFFCDPQTGEGFEGKVVSNEKIPEDICVLWNTGLFSSYDEEWLDKFTTIISSDYLA
jgi:hypothetical protein